MRWIKVGREQAADVGAQGSTELLLMPRLTGSSGSSSCTAALCLLHRSPEFMLFPRQRLWESDY